MTQVLEWSSCDSSTSGPRVRLTWGRSDCFLQFSRCFQKSAAVNPVDLRRYETAMLNSGIIGPHLPCFVHSFRFSSVMFSPTEDPPPTHTHIGARFHPRSPPDAGLGVMLWVSEDRWIHDYQLIRCPSSQFWWWNCRTLVNAFSKQHSQEWLRFGSTGASQSVI